MNLRISERKWFNKTIAAYQHHWLANFRSARSADNFVRGVARATGLPASTIRKSLPFKNFRAAQRDGKSYLALALKNIRAAFKAGTWRKNYLRAFGGTGAVAAARPKRKKRKTKKKKKATKKKGGKKKIYGTKSAAKKAATKGRYPYKVKGGWSLSKKKKSKKKTSKKSTKKKSTKKRSTKKKGRTTKKKIYKTKSAAKSAATKGRYPYKVKGGWCLSKKR